MKIICSLAICLLFFTSCEKELEMYEPEAIYEFQGIEYFLAESDGIKMDSFLISSDVVINNSSGIMAVEMKEPYPNKTSQFSVIDPVPFKLVNLDSVVIRVPIHINEDKIMLGDYKWQYNANNIEELPNDQLTLTTTAELPSRTKYSVDIYARRVNISTHYTATYIEQRTGISLKVTGKWKGQLINGTNTIARVDSL